MPEHEWSLYRHQATKTKSEKSTLPPSNKTLPKETCVGSMNKMLYNQRLASTQYTRKNDLFYHEKLFPGNLVYKIGAEIWKEKIGWIENFSRMIWAEVYGE